MLKYAIRRTLEAIPVLLLITVVTFAAMRLAPGDPAVLRMGREAGRPENRPRLEQLRKEMGLDRPIYIQYGIWLGEILRGEFGLSTRNKRPVAELIAGRLPATLELLAAALVISLVVAIPAGVLAAARAGTWVDRLIMALVASGLAIPSFWLGLVLILVLSVQLRWLPASGYVPLQENPLTSLRHLILPATALAAYLAATFIRFLRADLLEVLSQDYIRTAYAKGSPPLRVLFGHALKNALIPTLTVLGIETGALLGGAVIIEQVFGWSGIGWLAVQAIFDRDYPLVQGVTLFTATAFVGVNLLVDILYGFLNPRIRVRLEEA